MSEVVARPPGWVLVATGSGTHGWHVVDRLGTEGSIRTACGLTGRAIRDDQTHIVRCEECRTALEAQAARRSARSS